MEKLMRLGGYLILLITTDSLSLNISESENNCVLFLKINFKH
jgi:hypothetical protein